MHIGPSCPKPRYDASQGFRARVKIHNKGRVAAKKCAVRVVSVREIRPGGVHRRSDIPTIRLHWQDTGGDLLDIVADDDPGIEVVCADFPHPVARLGPHKIWEGGITLITLRVTGENIRAVQRTFFFSCHHRRYHAGWRWEEWRTPWYPDQHDRPLSQPEPNRLWPRQELRAVGRRRTRIVGTVAIRTGALRPGRGRILRSSSGSR